MEKKNAVPVIKNESYDVSVETLGAEGEGIAKLDGYTLFVEGALPGDKVRIKVLKTKKNYGYGKIEEIIEPSKDRVEPICPIAKQCGGCQLQHMAYPAQLEFKRQKVEQALIRIGGLTDIVVPPTIGMDEPYYYRNKGQFPVSDAGGTVLVGFYAARSHRLIPIETCFIQNKVHEAIIAVIKKYMEENSVSAYNEATHTGLVRHIVMRQSFANKDINITLVLNGKRLPESAVLVEMLMEIEGVKGICININKEKTNVIMGKNTQVLHGHAYIEDTIGDLTFRISPKSFYQVNPVQTQKLYEKALEFAQLTGKETVWDVYSGIGTISLFLAQKAKQVYGVEMVEEAIEDANYNKELNKIDNVEFFIGKAEEVLAEKYKDGIRADVIVIDPPRKGCEESLLKTMLDMAPKRIVYVSCDPATLARDVKVLVEGGYAVAGIQPVDMFPQGVHIESVCLLTKNNQ